jgi:nucleoside-diphosphate-sugar epimerase
LLSRVVVTGANGFIGRWLVRELRETGAHVQGWTRAHVDLNDAAAIRQALDRIAPDTIFHLAASGVAPHSQQEECIERDLAMTANLITSAAPGTLFIQAGSMAEYGFSGRLAEDAQCRPRSDYGRAKLAATDHALVHGPGFGLRVRVARIFGAYGPGERAGRLIPTLTERLRRGRPVPLSDGSQRRDFIHLSDCCSALIRIAKATAGGEALVVNVGTGRALTLRTACERIADALRADRALLQFGVLARRATDEDVLEANTDRLAALTGSVPPQRLATSNDGEIRNLIGA